MIKIKELRIGNKVSVNKGFEMEVCKLRLVWKLEKITANGSGISDVAEFQHHS